MATALKHQQRSHRSYQNNRKTMGSLAVYGASLANSHYFMNQVGFIERIKQMFGMKKGDR